MTSACLKFFNLTSILPHHMTSTLAVAPHRYEPPYFKGKRSEGGLLILHRLINKKNAISETIDTPHLAKSPMAKFYSAKPFITKQFTF